MRINHMKLLSQLNNALFAFAVLMIFIWLAYASIQQHGYDVSEIEALNQLVENNTVRRDPQRLSQSAAIAEVWGLTQDDVVKPVCLFGKEGKCI